MSQKSQSPAATGLGQQSSTSKDTANIASAAAAQDNHSLAELRRTANLQSPMKLMASALNVSERSLYMAKKIGRLRPDLIPQVRAGAMRLNKAYRIATNYSKPTKVEQAVRAYRRLSDEEQAHFRGLIDGDVGGRA